MTHRCLPVVFLVTLVVGLTPMPAAAQATNTSPPRTAWGQPDLGGIWEFKTRTRLERPERYGEREFLTEEEAAEIERGEIEQNHTLGEPARSANRGDPRCQCPPRPMAGPAGSSKPQDGTGLLQLLLVRLGHDRRRDAAHVADRGSAEWQAARQDGGWAGKSEDHGRSFVLQRHHRRVTSGP